jgi:hypothetical protein
MVGILMNSNEELIATPLRVMAMRLYTMVRSRAANGTLPGPQWSTPIHGASVTTAPSLGGLDRQARYLSLQ